MQENPLVAVSGVRKSIRRGRQDVELLCGIDLEVHRGELVCITGRSGVGKTTLLHLIAGLDKPTTGTITVAGESLADLSDRKLAHHRGRFMGVVFQSFNLLDHLTVGENTMLPAAFRRRGQNDVRERAMEALEWVGLANRADDLPVRLSGGERQRVALARAVFARPALLICDEVTGNLDRETAQEVARLIGWLCRDEKTAVIAATHDPRLVLGSSRVLKLEAGRLQLADRGVCQ